MPLNALYRISSTWFDSTQRLKPGPTMQTRWLVGDFNEKEWFELQHKAGENRSLHAGFKVTKALELRGAGELGSWANKSGKLQKSCRQKIQTAFSETKLFPQDGPQWTNEEWSAGLLSSISMWIDCDKWAGARCRPMPPSLRPTRKNRNRRKQANPNRHSMVQPYWFSIKQSHHGGGVFITRQSETVVMSLLS